MSAYRVVLAPAAAKAVLAIGSRDDARRVARRLRALQLAPEIGAVYDPLYEAAWPDHKVRVTYAGHFGLYYTLDEMAGVVAVEYVEDTRRDPKKRFGGIGRE